MKSRFNPVFCITLVFLVCTSTQARPLSNADLETLKTTDAHQSPSQAAVALANQIGRDKNLDGIRAIINLSKLSLLYTAIGSYNLRSTRVLPDELETLIVEQYSNKQAKRTLLGLIARELENGERFPKYRSHKLFDLLYADLNTKSNDRGWYASRIIATDLQGIEPALASLLPAVNQPTASVLVPFFGTRRYAPAVPVLLALRKNTPLASDTNGLLENINTALLKIGTQDAMQAVFDRLKTLNKQSDDPRAESEIAGILYSIARLPPDKRTEYSALHAALPKQLDKYAQQAMVKLIVDCKDKRGMPDLILGLSQGSNEALNGLLELGTPEDWRVGKTKLNETATASTLRPAQITDFQKRLDAALADPNRFSAERAETERKKSFANARLLLSNQIAALATLRGSDPKRYAVQMESVLRKMEKLIESNAGLQDATWYRRDAAQGYLHLAAYTRFTLHDPSHAVLLYQRAIAMSEGLPVFENMGVLERTGLADTLRFDLGKKAEALQIYQKLLQRASSNHPSTNDIEATVQHELMDWLRAEIAFLSTGKRYAGSTERNASGGLASLMFVGSGLNSSDDLTIDAMTQILHTRVARDDERDKFAHQLETLSPSQARLISVANFLPLLGTPERIEKFMRKHDPTGYLTANLFAMWHGFEQISDPKTRQHVPPGMHIFNWTANEHAVMDQTELAILGRHIALKSKPDPDLKNPETTWKTFMNALRKADLDTAWKCTTPGIRNKFESILRSLTPAQLKEMADSKVGFKTSAALGEFIEAVVVDVKGNAGIVTFVKQGEEWLISEM